MRVKKLLFFSWHAALERYALRAEARSAVWGNTNLADILFRQQIRIEGVEVDANAPLFVAVKILHGFWMMPQYASTLCLPAKIVYEPAIRFFINRIAIRAYALPEMSYQICGVRA